MHARSLHAKNLRGKFSSYVCFVFGCRTCFHWFGTTFTHSIPMSKPYRSTKYIYRLSFQSSCLCMYVHSFKYADDWEEINVRSILSYPSIFPTGGTGPSSDAGWGCMLRCGQMMLAQALICRHLGRGEFHLHYRWFQRLMPYRLLLLV